MTGNCETETEVSNRPSGHDPRFPFCYGLAARALLHLSNSKGSAFVLKWKEFAYRQGTVRQRQRCPIVAQGTILAFRFAMDWPLRPPGTRGFQFVVGTLHPGWQRETTLLVNHHLE